MDKLKAAFIWCVRKTPIFSGLPDVKWKFIKSAIAESLMTLTIATIPLWLGAFILSMNKGIISPSIFIDGLRALTEHGELALFSASLLAPVAYIFVDEKLQNKRFPAKVSHLSSLIVIVALAAVIYSQSIRSNAPVENMPLFSLCLFIMSVIILSVALAYRNNLVDAAEEYRQQDKDYGDRYLAYREGRS